MPYHFHLIRNILKLTYCFPIETPSAPKSDNQAGGCQGPSVLGRVHAAGTKKDLPILPQSLLSSWDGFWQLAKVLALARGLGGVSCHLGKRKGPRTSAEWPELDESLPRCSLIVRLSRRKHPAPSQEPLLPPGPRQSLRSHLSQVEKQGSLGLST